MLCNELTFQFTLTPVVYISYTRSVLVLYFVNVHMILMLFIIRVLFLAQSDRASADHP